MSDTEIATVAGGCFWYRGRVTQLAGVERVTSGTPAGVENPSYEARLSRRDGSRRVRAGRVRPGRALRGRPDGVLRRTTPRRRTGGSETSGSQYRSAVFYHGEAQREAVEAFVDDLQSAYDDDIVTESRRSTRTAGDVLHRGYHQDCSRRTRTTPTVHLNAAPKVEKVRKQFQELMAASDEREADGPTPVTDDEGVLLRDDGRRPLPGTSTPTATSTTRPTRPTWRRPADYSTRCWATRRSLATESAEGDGVGIVVASVDLQYRHPSVWSIR